MAPINDGYWGKPTSTLDWCEENYEVTRYIAEFWNTVSNVALIFLPFYGGWLTRKRELEYHYLLCYISLFAVGVGSWCFHMTLRYEMQLLDELPMFWGCLVLLYALLEVRSPPKKLNLPLVFFLMFYGLTVSVAYILITHPLFFQIAYGMLVGIIVCIDVHLATTQSCKVWIFVAAATSYSLGFCLWNIDNIFCSELTMLRKHMPFFLRPLFQLHGWWHCLAGYGTYLQILYFCHARLTYKKCPCEIEAAWPLLFIFADANKRNVQ